VLRAVARSKGFLGGGGGGGGVRLQLSIVHCM